jgi:hypothetical protein
MNQPRIQRMWQHGPCRLFSEQRFQGAVPFSGGGLKGYAGPYICSGCQRQTHKVLGNFGGDDWVCEDCVSRYRKGTGTGTPSRPLSFQIEK